MNVYADRALHLLQSIRRGESPAIASRTSLSGESVPPWQDRFQEAYVDDLDGDGHIAYPATGNGVSCTVDYGGNSRVGQLNEASTYETGATLTETSFTPGAVEQVRVHCQEGGCVLERTFFDRLQVERSFQDTWILRDFTGPQERS